MTRLADKSIIITGAASGIGAASARLFAAEGAGVTAVDRDAAGLAEVVGAITASGGRAQGVTADVSKEEDWARIFQAALDAYAGVDVLFNNAGIGVTGTILDTPPAEWDQVHSINLRGVYLGCRTVLQHMIDRGGGVIVNTASELGTVGGPEIAAYCAAKFGVVGLTKSIAIDFAAKGIRANALCPGPVDTPLLRRDEEGSGKRPAGANDTPMGRWGQPAEAAQAALFLASDASSFMTGATLVVDGGLTAR